MAGRADGDDRRAGIEVHEVVGRIERAMRDGRATAKGAIQVWGVALTRGERDGQEVIMATTLGGERLPLTPALVGRLRWVALCLQGSALCVIDPADPQPIDDDVPIPAVELLTVVAPDYASRSGHTAIPTTVTPESLRYTDIVITARQRPEGWPR